MLRRELFPSESFIGPQLIIAQSTPLRLLKDTMLGVIIAIVVVSVMFIAVVTRYWYKRRQAKKRRRSDEGPKPLVFIAGILPRKEF